MDELTVEDIEATIKTLRYFERNSGAAGQDKDKSRIMTMMIRNTFALARLMIQAQLTPSTPTDGGGILN